MSKVNLLQAAKQAQFEVAVEADSRVRLLRKENSLLKRSQAERDTGRDILLNVLREVFADADPITLHKLPPQGNGRAIEEAVLHVCDTHYGKRTSTYRLSVAEERTILLAEKVVQITNLRRHNARIEHLHLFLGGDMSEGEGEIFPGQAHEIDSDVMTQSCLEGPRIVAELMLTLLSQYKRITVKAVPGNHGRVSKIAAKRNNFDNWFYEILRYRVNSSLHAKDLRRLTWDLPCDRELGLEWYSHDVICDRWGALQVHGDQIKGMLGFPWYGFGKKVNGWIDTVPYPWNYIYSGHFHTLVRCEMNKRTVLGNGSMESSNQYAAESLAACGEPVQRLGFYNKDIGLISDDPIYLMPRAPNR